MPACVLPERAPRAFVDAAYALARRHELLDGDGATGWGARAAAGYPGVADLVLRRLRGEFRACRAAFAAARPFYDVVSGTDDLVLVLAKTTPTADGRARVVALED